MREFAFPTTPVMHGYEDGAAGHGTGSGPGMTLRDYFAAKAMQGLLSQAGGSAYSSCKQEGAKYAYEMADAMLAAREKKAEAPNA